MPSLAEMIAAQKKGKTNESTEQKPPATKSVDSEPPATSQRADERGPDSSTGSGSDIRKDEPSVSESKKPQQLSQSNPLARFAAASRASKEEANPERDIQTERESGTGETPVGDNGGEQGSSGLVAKSLLGSGIQPSGGDKTPADSINDDSGQDDAGRVGTGSDSGVVHSGPITLESIAKSTVQGPETVDDIRARIRSQFPDEIPADAPEREFAEDTDPALLDFMRVVDGLYDRLADPEMFSKQVRHVMLEMQEHPQYEKQLVDDDKARLMEGLRAAMGETREKKTVEKRKRTKTASKKSATRSKLAGKLAGKLGALAAIGE